MNARPARAMMTLRIGLWVVLFSLTAAGCSSTQDKANKAQAEYTEEKTKTLQEYKKCIKNAKGDEVKLQQCDALLKAIEAVEGKPVEIAE